MVRIEFVDEAEGIQVGDRVRLTTRYNEYGPGDVGVVTRIAWHGPGERAVHEVVGHIEDPSRPTAQADEGGIVVDLRNLVTRKRALGFFEGGYRYTVKMDRGREFSNLFEGTSVSVRPKLHLKRSEIEKAAGRGG